MGVDAEGMDVQPKGGRCGCGCGGCGQGRGNDNAVAQPPPLITWKDLDKDKEFTNNSLKEFIEVSGVNRCLAREGKGTNYSVKSWPMTWYNCCQINVLTVILMLRVLAEDLSAMM